ncbi:serine hydrolase domain-containing protein [Ruminococcus sp.]|uniref:serine hydrolase domain-containing protein n=1 Tax=Ruminococcus sp. TaxID=41978 RepID=UPI0038902C06
MTKSELHQMIADSIGNESNICQIYAIKNGVRVYDDCWHEYITTDAVNVMSVTKSVMALLIGIAIDKGYIRSVDQKVIDFFPDYTVKRGEKTIYKVTLRHLLTMTAPYKYRSEPWTKVCTSDDWTKAALDLLGGRNGITGEFKYATLGIQILSGVIQNTSGMKCNDFANKYLFAPLGIPAHTIHGASDKNDQIDYLMNKAPKKNEWYSDPKDTVTAGWGLCLSAEDMAKIGVLILNSGEYDNKRIISTNWIEEMTAPRIALGERFGNMHYGYLWYRPHKDKRTVAAIGDGGNVIYVNIEQNISIGVTGTFKPRVFDRIEFIEKNILPLIS